MDGEHTWPRLIIALLSSPEKIALGLVIAVGAWRWIRELIREARGAAQEETLVEMLLRENRELRAREEYENRALREELRILREKFNKEHQNE